MALDVARHRVGRRRPAGRARRPRTPGRASCWPRSSAWRRRTRRRPRAGSRRRSATTTTRRSTPRTSCGARTRPPTCARRGADRRGARRHRAARALRGRVHAQRRRRLSPRALRRGDTQAAAAGRRPHRARHRHGAARGGGARRRSRRSTTRRCAPSTPAPGGWRVTLGQREGGPGAAVDCRRGRAGRGRPLLRRGQAAGDVLDQRGRSHRRGDGDRPRGRLRGARPRRPAVPPERRPVADRDAGLLDPRDHPCLRGAPAERRGASASSTSSPLATSSPRRSCASARRAAGCRRPRAAPSVLLDCRPVDPADAAISLPYMLRRYRAAGIDPLAEPIHTYPVLHYQNGGLRHRRATGATTVDGLLRRGRDHRRRPRPEPDDGQLAARLRGLRLAGGPRRGRLSA